MRAVGDPVSDGAQALFDSLQYIDVPNRRVVFASFSLPITNMLDWEGDETDDIRNAVAVVAGEGDLWVNLQLGTGEPDGRLKCAVN